MFIYKLAIIISITKNYKLKLYMLKENISKEIYL